MACDKSIVGPKGCCGPFFAIVTSVILLTALAVPWFTDISFALRSKEAPEFSDELDYNPRNWFGNVFHKAVEVTLSSRFTNKYGFSRSSTKTHSNGKDDPKQFNDFEKDAHYDVNVYGAKFELRSWEDAFCSAYTKEGYEHLDFYTCPASQYTWRIVDCDDGNCSSLRTTYSSTSLFTALATCVSIITAILSTNRSCGSSKPGRSTPLIFFSVATTLITVIAIGIFGMTHSTAMKYAYENSPRCLIPGTDTLMGPCEHLFGAYLDTVFDPTTREFYEYVRMWLPSGLFVALVAVFISLASMYFAFLAVPARSWENIHYAELIEPMRPQDPYDTSVASINYDSSHQQNSQRNYQQVPNYPQMYQPHQEVRY